MLSGDIEQRIENKLVADHIELASDFLKVPHHGSKTSSTEAFLGAVAPRVAVVSVGESNPFGHPAANIVERYSQAGVRLLRTDQDGATTALTDGQDLTVRTFAETLRDSESRTVVAVRPRGYDTSESSVEELPFAYSAMMRFASSASDSRT